MNNGDSPSNLLHQQSITPLLQLAHYYRTPKYPFLFIFKPNDFFKSLAHIQDRQGKAAHRLLKMYYRGFMMGFSCK